MEVLLLAIAMASNILCFLIGAMVGQKARKGEEIRLPAVNPMEAIRERESKREAQKKSEMVETILRNIDKYDGTPFGQEDVPGR